jgi:hypothetical protein
MTIDEICNKYKIENYTINNDGSIDVDGDVDLSYEKLTELPLTFNKVSGNFNCSINQLTRLKGSPRWVGGWFSCSYNDLTSLEFSPEYVGGNFLCDQNKFTDLIGSPKQVGEGFHCGFNQYLINPKGSPEKIGKEFNCSNSPIGSIFNNVDRDFIHAFNFYKIIKDKTINLKRLKYVMDIHEQPIYIEDIKRHYTII